MKAEITTVKTNDDMMLELVGASPSKIAKKDKTKDWICIDKEIYPDVYNTVLNLKDKMAPAKVNFFVAFCFRNMSKILPLLLEEKTKLEAEKAKK